MTDTIYIVTKDTDGMGRQKNIRLTDDPDEAKQLCDDEYIRGQPTFIEVWEVGSDEPEYVTRENPAELQ